MAPKRRVSSTTLLNECTSEPMRFSYKTMESDTMVTLSGDAMKEFFTNVIQPAQHDASNTLWNLQTMLARRFEYNSQNISEWYLSNNEIEVYYQDIPKKLERDLSPNAPSTFKLTKQGVVTNGIYIRRRFQNKIVRETAKNNNTLLELGISKPFFNSNEYQIQWFINGPNYKKIIKKHETLEALTEYLKINELSDNLKWYQCGLTWLKKWFHLMPPMVDTTKRLRKTPYAMIKFDSFNYYYPEWQPDTYHVLNGIYRYAYPVSLSIKKEPLYKELEHFGVNMRKLIAKTIS